MNDNMLYEPAKVDTDDPAIKNGGLLGDPGFSALILCTEDLVASH